MVVGVSWECISVVTLLIILLVTVLGKIVGFYGYQVDLDDSVLECWICSPSERRTIAVVKDHNGSLPQWWHMSGSKLI
jgi:uncharacterized membrane protein YpjA